VPAQKKFDAYVFVSLSVFVGWGKSEGRRKTEIGRGCIAGGGEGGGTQKQTDRHINKRTGNMQDSHTDARGYTMRIQQMNTDRHNLWHEERLKRKTQSCK
jgi:hypothetical protein